jgi:hypothetical protein
MCASMNVMQTSACECTPQTNRCAHAETDDTSINGTQMRECVGNTTNQCTKPVQAFIQLMQRITALAEPELVWSHNLMHNAEQIFSSPAPVKSSPAPLLPCRLSSCC